MGLRAAEPATGATLDPTLQDGSHSVTIAALMDRRSVLGEGAFARVADGVLAANSRTAEAELRAAILRSEATQKNWLPTLGPQVSLTNMGSIVAQMFVDQVLFDNGGKKAEREMARADVEVAAVALAADTNKRVLTALDLYLTAEAMDARAAVSAAGITRMSRFEYVMSERVKGGVTDRADWQVVVQKLNQMRADQARDLAAAEAARSELAAMSQGSLAGLSGTSPIATPPLEVQMLNVMKAEAEARRAVATARAARAGFLPGLSARGTLGDGADGLGLTVAAPNGLGFGTAASLQAIEAEEQAANARVGQAREDADRRLRGLEGQLAALVEENSQAQLIARQAAANFDAYDAQLRAGRRAVPDVISIFETKIGAERAAATLPFEIDKLRLEIAAERGALVEGGKI